MAKYVEELILEKKIVLPADQEEVRWGFINFEILDWIRPTAPSRKREPKPIENRAPSKRLRFEVFKRDGFACVYCGAKPPDVELCADHVTPYSKGGPTVLGNLVTACQPCNAGKADVSL